jgi:phosphohistidine phosphatase SixA
MSCFFRLSAVVLGFFALNALAQPTVAVNGINKSLFVERMADRALIDELRKGGYVLYIRHGITDNSRADRYPSVDLNDCSTQRVLSDQGRSLMREVGKQIRAAKIPVGEMLVSPMCRTRESAELMGIRLDFSVIEPLMYSANMTSAEKQPRLEALKALLVKPVPRGSNRVLLAHAPNLADLIGFFVKPEGTVVVFSQQGARGYEYVASIHPASWRDLLE